MKNRKILLFVLLMTGNLLFCQTITFDVDNVLAGPAECNWMFETDDVGFPTHDGNPFTTGGVVDINNFAYRFFLWNEDIEHPLSASICTEENLDVLNGIQNVSLRFDNFRIGGFDHINTVDPDAQWNIAGQAGDERTYTFGEGEIYVNGELKLKVINCRLTVEVPYPTAEEMREILDPLAPNWQTDVGTGTETTASGWGVIDVANSDPAWVAELDPFGFGMLRLEISTISHVIQDYYGYYDFEVTVHPAPHFELIIIDELPLGRGTILDLSAADVTFDFDAGAISGGQPPDDDNLRTVIVNQVKTSPSGALPLTINAVYPMYWEISTTLTSFTTDVTFDLEEVSGYSNPQNLRILCRDQSDAEWTVWNDFTLADASHIRANNVSEFSDWAIGSITDDPLPVELSGFFAVETSNNLAELSWTTQSESNMDGYNVYRSTEENSDTAIQMNADIISATNTTQTQTYSFSDSEVISGSTYFYWLESVENDGSTSLHGPAVITMNSEDEEEQTPEIGMVAGIQSIYPNPFNPTTTLSYFIAKDSNVTIEIYNTKGQLVYTMNEGEKEANKIFNVKWEGQTFGGKSAASGTYIFRLKAGDFVQTKKAVLMK